LGSYQLTDAQLLEAHHLIDQGLAKAALFNEKPNGELISLHPYFYAIGDKRFMNGFCSQIYKGTMA
jgi:hypothetical protein